MRPDDIPSDLRVLDPRLFPHLRRLIAVGLVVGPLTGHIVFWGMVMVEVTVESTFSPLHIPITGMAFLITLPVAYIIGFPPAVFGSLLLYRPLLKIRRPAALYATAALCGFTGVALGLLIWGMTGRSISMEEIIAMAGIFGVFPAIVSFYCFRKGMFARLDRRET